MSHTVRVKLIANQQVEFRESRISIYDIECIVLTECCKIKEIVLKSREGRDER